eukprot:m.132009 g.132009  ORF g.132009 m.132009 type:complete len:240 (-) comp29580_c0_seq2:119-838(-)
MAGQIGLEPATMTLPTSLLTQTKLSLLSVANVIAANGTHLSACLLTTCFVTDLKMVPVIDAEYRQWREERCPEIDFVPPTYVQIDGLPRAAKVEWHLITLCKRETVLSFDFSKVIGGAETTTLLYSPTTGHGCWSFTLGDTSAMKTIDAKEFATSVCLHTQKTTKDHHEDLEMVDDCQAKDQLAFTLMRAYYVPSRTSAAHATMLQTCKQTFGVPISAIPVADIMCNYSVIVQVCFRYV